MGKSKKKAVRSKDKPTVNKPTVLMSKQLLVNIPSFDLDRLTEGEMERLMDFLEDEIEMGLKAVGENVTSKFGSGKLSFEVK